MTMSYPPGWSESDRTHFHDHHQARRAVFEFIEGWYTRIVVTKA